MRWLIIEDALEGPKGHWYEFLQGFCQQLPKLGDEVVLLSSRRAEGYIFENLGALPLLPESLPLRHSKTGKVRRVFGAVSYFVSSYRVISKYIRGHPDFDWIFISDATLYHLVVWIFLVKTVLHRRKTRILLYFMGLPICQNGGEPTIDGSFTSKAMKRLLNAIAPEIRRHKVVLGVETQAMKRGGELTLALPFSYFPQSVQCYDATASTPQSELSDCITMACYGPARHEKGSDILVAAIKKYLECFPDGSVRFIFQWIEDFSVPDHDMACVPGELRNHPRVEIVTRFFQAGEYAKYLGQTQVLLLPYRKSSYSLRGSRVVVEAMVNGVPAITTRGTTLHDSMQTFGADLVCEDGDIESLAACIREMELRNPEFQKQARERQPSAREHYSIRTFRDTLLSVEAVSSA